jgi:AcrR family transcriptional regulator
MTTERPSAQPGPGGGREARHRENEARILAAARQVLQERVSSDALPLREVAARAGFTPGALYRYFAGRDELINAVFLDALRTLGEYLAAATGDTASERLEALAHAYFAFAADCPRDLVLIFESAVPAADWSQYITVAWPFTLIIAAVDQGIASGELAPLPGLDAAGTAYVVWGQVHGLAMLKAGHLSRTAGPFDAMHAAAVRDLVGRLATSRSAG